MGYIATPATGLVASCKFIFDYLLIVIIERHTFKVCFADRVPNIILRIKNFKMFKISKLQIKDDKHNIQT